MAPFLGSPNGRRPTGLLPSMYSAQDALLQNTCFWCPAAPSTCEHPNVRGKPFMFNPESRRPRLQ